jgi:hypothetical protein
LGFIRLCRVWVYKVFKVLWSVSKHLRILTLGGRLGRGLRRWRSTVGVPPFSSGQTRGALGLRS